MSAKPKVHVDPEAKNMLRALQESGDPDLYAQLIEIFVRTSDEFANSLKQLSVSTQVTSIKDIAHSWRSSASTIGAKALAALCIELEAAAQARDEAQIVSLIQKILAEFSAVKSELAKDLSRPPNK